MTSIAFLAVVFLQTCILRVAASLLLPTIQHERSRSECSDGENCHPKLSQKPVPNLFLILVIS